MSLVRSFAALCTLLLMIFTATAHEPLVEFLHLHDPTAAHEASSEYYKLAAAVQLQNEHLKNVSSSVLMAESWLKTHVLAHYPGVGVTTILVGHNVVCNGDEEHNLDLVLPSLKNIHYSLTRWGLEKVIKVSTSFSDKCLDSESKGYYRADLLRSHIQPLLHTLKEMNSPYILNPNPASSDETFNTTLKSHCESMKNLGYLHLFKKIITITETPRKQEPFTRKLLSFTESDAKTPLPPLIGTIISPQRSFTAPSLAPEPNLKSPTLLSPMANPSSPPYPPHLPPCVPSGSSVAPPPVHNHGGGMWCVAKPSVPPETLQLALDYACGEGGADCEAIKPHGSCFYPDNVLAHASYAFNSYWQKAKKHGGTCGFSGTAILLNSDPSYGNCRFMLA